MMRALPACAAPLALAILIAGCGPHQPANDAAMPAAEANVLAPGPVPLPVPPVPGADGAAGNSAVPAMDAGAAATGTTIPERFQGIYDRDSAGCAERVSVFRLRVSARDLRFHESVAEVRTVTPQGPDTIRVASDFSGEGEEWSALNQLTLTDDAARLTVAHEEGEPSVRIRC